MSETERPLPHNDLAEKAVLGAMLVNNRYVNEVFSQLESSDFYRRSHLLIASAILKITNDGRPADIITVADQLQKSNEINQAGGYAYVAALADEIPENLDIVEYINIIKDHSALRKLITSSRSIIEESLDFKADADTILAQVQESIIKIAEARDKRGFVPTGKLMPEAMRVIENIQKHGESGGLKSGFYELDDIISGFQPGEFSVIAARPSMGKTALALNIVLNMALKQEKTVGFFSIEMSREQIMMRLLATRSKISMSSIRTGKPLLSRKEWHDLELASSEIERAKIFIDDSPSLSIVEMKTRARRLKIEHSLDIVFVDYLQLMKVGESQVRKNDSRAQEVAIISSSLKELAKELGIPVLALAQLNRSPETRGRGEKGAKYQLSDLKESGAIEQDADLIVFLHREEQNDKDTERKGEADLIVAKQRNGPTGRAVLAYIDKFTKFANLEIREREEV